MLLRERGRISPASPSAASPPILRAVAALDAFDVPFPERRNRPRRGDRVARHYRLTGDGGDDRPAVLRVRERRHPPGRGGSCLADDRVGSEHRPHRHVPDRFAARPGGASAGWSTLSVSPSGPGGAFVTGATMANATVPCRSPRCRAHAHRLGRPSRRACRSTSDHRVARRGGAQHGEQGARHRRARARSGADPSFGLARHGFSPTTYRRSTDRRSSVSRPATSTVARATRSAR